MKPKILLCPLVSDDYDRAVRAIRSAYNQKKHNLLFSVHVVINSQDDDFIQNIVKYCKFNNIPHSVTESDGTPSTGKNAVFDVFKESDCTHLSQLDGDDLFYPTFLTQTERHLKKYPTTDVLCTIPVDLLLKNPEENAVLLDTGYYALLWGIHYLYWETVSKIGRDSVVDGVSTSNYGRFVLYSRKIVDMNFRYDPTFIVGEDKKLHYDFLFAHQKDEISYWFTSASDMWVCDRMSFGTQKKQSNTIIDGEYHIVVDPDGGETTKRLQEYVTNLMIPNRTAPGEIPVDYCPVFLQHHEKVEFLNEFLIK